MVKTQNNPLAMELLLQKGYLPKIQGDFLVFDNLTDDGIAQVNRNLVQSYIDVLRIEEHKKNLESIFLDMTGRERSL